MTHLDQPQRASRWRAPWHAPLAATLLAGIAYLALHVPFLAWSPDDIDATNFMLAMHDYDLREHQPHPPGYPVFVGMARAARTAMSVVGPLTGPPTSEALDVNALAFCSALFGALAMLPLVALWTDLGRDRARAWLAAILAISSPVFWYTGIRPLSDLPGLTLAFASLALLIGQISRTSTPSTSTKAFAGAALAGVAVGIRTQTLWLTAPTIGAAAAFMLWRREPRSIAALIGGFVASVIAWGIPLMAVMGGWRSYLDVVTAQAADDFRGAILAVDFSPRALALGVYDTFTLPWAGAVLATVVLLLALAGALRLVTTRPREILLLALVFLPYLTLHLVFQDAHYTRYALPLVPPIAYLAVCGLNPVSRLRWSAGVVLVLAALGISIGPVVDQARLGSPGVRALSDVREALTTVGTKPVIAMHHAVQRQLRFAAFDEALLPTAPRYEWLAVVDHFRTGGEAPVWFLANRRRSDLALFDPVAKRALHEYGWTFDAEAVLGGAQPKGVTWYEISRPGWMAGEGWALTPETRGVAERARRSPGDGATVAYLARRPESAIMLVGGRNLGGPCHTAARLQATLDGRPIADWTLPAGQPFLHFVELPAGALAGPRGFSELRLQAADLSGAGRGVDVSLEQFDVQSGQRPMTGLALGWHEPELDTDTGERWRWAGQRAFIQIQNFGRNVVLMLKADDPTLTLGRSMELQVRSGGRVLGRRRFDAAIDWSVLLPADVIDQAGGRVTLMSDASFVPDLTEHNGDLRELSLRVFNLDIEFDEQMAKGGT